VHHSRIHVDDVRDATEALAVAVASVASPPSVAC
jgi:hypothetical protein